MKTIICLSFSDPASNLSSLFCQTPTVPHIFPPILSHPYASCLRVDPPSDGGGKARQRLLLARVERRVGGGDGGGRGCMSNLGFIFSSFPPPFWLLLQRCLFSFFVKLSCGLRLIGSCIWFHFSTVFDIRVPEVLYFRMETISCNHILVFLYMHASGGSVHAR